MSGASRATLRLGVVSDLHHSERPESGLAFHGLFEVERALDRLGAAISWFRDEAVDALVIAGDLAHHGDPPSLLAVLRAALDGWAGTVLLAAGNHDRLGRADALAAAAVGLDQARLLLPPPAGILLEAGSDGAAAGRATVRVAGFDPELASPREAVASWGEDPVVLLSHWPLLSRRERFAELGLRYAGDPPGQAAWAAALTAREAPTLIVNGHLHAPDACRRAAVLQLSVPALVEPPFEATIVELGAGGVSRRARSL